VQPRKVSFGEAMGLFSGPPARRGGGDDGGELPPISVSELADRMKVSLEALGTLRVAGEISNFAERGGHWYFTLKDDAASVSCAMFREANRTVAFAPDDGLAVVASGMPSYYGRFGRAQLYVRKLERKGLGSLQERLQALIRELSALGYLDEARKRALPEFPARIAVVTGRDSAAEADVVRTARMRFAGTGLLLVDVRVQGEQAAPQVTRAIGLLDRHAKRLGIDCILVTRGGGSLEDLWAFNERIVADAVFARRNVPIVAAIGHETDTTVIELVADRRASTPTQAITLLVPDAESLGERLDAAGGRLRQAMRVALAARRGTLERLARHAFLRRPDAGVAAARERIDRAERALERVLERRVERARERVVAAGAGLRPRRLEARTRLAAADLRRLAAGLRLAATRSLDRGRARVEADGRQLVAVGPESVLSRGFSYTLGADGSLLRSAGSVRPGERIRTVLADGTVDSEVVAPAEAPRPRAAARRRDGPGVGEPGLFGGDAAR